MHRSFNIPAISSQILLEVANFFSDHHGTCLLFSGGVLDSAQRSFLALFPFETIEAYGKKLVLNQNNCSQTIEVQNPWIGLEDFFFRSLANDDQSKAFGWFGYGLAAFADPDKKLPYRPSSLPDAYWQRCSIVLEIDHKINRAVCYLDLSGIEKICSEWKKWILSLASYQDWEIFLKKLPKRSFTYTKIHCAEQFSDSPLRRSVYIDKVNQAQELIRAGEIYQVNLSQRFEFTSARHPFSIFRQVCNENPAPFSAYFRFHRTGIVSTSPERFLFKKDNILETRPIKGTIKRGKTAEEDYFLKEQLMASPKERAELLMITDLMRNDLGKISSVGSVETTDLWRCEAYTNVFHLISIIKSKVKSNLKPLEIVRSCFPGGSISGCPKLRAIEVIDELEQQPRGLYTGSIGYFNGKGDFDLNIAIRTLIAQHDGCFSLHLGGGIVIDSNPEQEYQETLIKGASIFHTLQTEDNVSYD